MKITKQVLLAVLVMMLGFGGSLQALAKNNSGLPSSLSMATGGGVVQAIYNDKIRSEIVISDESFGISPTLVVRSITGKMLGGLALLRPGQKIAYKIATQSVKGQSNTYLVEAWLLPANFTMPEEWQ